MKDYSNDTRDFEEAKLDEVESDVLNLQIETTIKKLRDLKLNTISKEEKNNIFKTLVSLEKQLDFSLFDDLDLSNDGSEDLPEGPELI